MSSPSHSVWVDMYYRRAAPVELRPLVDRLLDQCDDVDGFIQKAPHRSFFLRYLDLRMIDTVCNGLKRAKKARGLSKNNVDFGVLDTGLVRNGLRQLQADNELQSSRVRAWLTELDVNPSEEGQKPIGDGMPLHESAYHRSRSRSPPITPDVFGSLPITPGDSASNYCPSPPGSSPPDSGEPFADQCVLQKADASGRAISVSTPAARTFLADYSVDLCKACATLEADYSGDLYTACATPVYAINDCPREKTSRGTPPSGSVKVQNLVKDFEDRMAETPTPTPRDRTSCARALQEGGTPRTNLQTPRINSILSKLRAQIDRFESGEGEYRQLVLRELEGAAHRTYSTEEQKHGNCRRSGSEERKHKYQAAEREVHELEDKVSFLALVHAETEFARLQKTLTALKGEAGVDPAEIGDLNRNVSRNRTKSSRSSPDLSTAHVHVLGNEPQFARSPDMNSTLHVSDGQQKAQLEMWNNVSPTSSPRVGSLQSSGQIPDLRLTQSSGPLAYSAVWGSSMMLLGSPKNLTNRDSIDTNVDLDPQCPSPPPSYGSVPLTPGSMPEFSTMQTQQQTQHFPAQEQHPPGVNAQSMYDADQASNPGKGTQNMLVQPGSKEGDAIASLISKVVQEKITLSETLRTAKFEAMDAINSAVRMRSSLLVVCTAPDSFVQHSREEIPQPLESADVQLVQKAGLKTATRNAPPAQPIGSVMPSTSPQEVKSRQPDGRWRKSWSGGSEDGLRGRSNAFSSLPYSPFGSMPPSSAASTSVLEASPESIRQAQPSPVASPWSRGLTVAGEDSGRPLYSPATVIPRQSSFSSGASNELPSSVSQERAETRRGLFGSSSGAAAAKKTLHDDGTIISGKAGMPSASAGASGNITELTSYSKAGYLCVGTETPRQELATYSEAGYLCVGTATPRQQVLQYFDAGYTCVAPNHSVSTPENYITTSRSHSRYHDAGAPETPVQRRQTVYPHGARDVGAMHSRTTGNTHHVKPSTPVPFLPASHRHEGGPRTPVELLRTPVELPRTPVELSSLRASEVRHFGSSTPVQFQTTLPQKQQNAQQHTPSYEHFIRHFGSSTPVQFSTEAHYPEARDSGATTSSIAIRKTGGQDRHYSIHARRAQHDMQTHSSTPTHGVIGRQSPMGSLHEFRYMCSSRYIGSSAHSEETNFRNMTFHTQSHARLSTPGHAALQAVDAQGHMLHHHQFQSANHTRHQFWAATSSAARPSSVGHTDLQHHQIQSANQIHRQAHSLHQYPPPSPSHHTKTSSVSSSLGYLVSPSQNTNSSSNSVLRSRVATAHSSSTAEKQSTASRSNSHYHDAGGTEERFTCGPPQKMQFL